MASSPAGPASSDVANRSRIISRIERDAGVPHLAEILSDRLAPTDLQSLLLEVYGRRAKKRDPKSLLDDHVSNRFTRPSAPIQHAFLSGTMSHSRHYQASFRLLNSHRFARWELVPYYLRLVRTGPFRPSEIRRSSPTRRTC
jgi:hypothetical protein